MARYRVEFAREWILGRWGFVDRVFNKLGGKETDASRLENAWLLEFRGRPRELGEHLSSLLSIHRKDFHQFGTIFEIQEVPPRGNPPDKPRAPAAAPRRPLISAR